MTIECLIQARQMFFLKASGIYILCFVFLLSKTEFKVSFEFCLQQPFHTKFNLINDLWSSDTIDRNLCCALVLTDVYLTIKDIGFYIEFCLLFHGNMGLGIG